VERNFVGVDIYAALELTKTAIDFKNAVGNIYAQDRGLASG
jgi:hypothetical protein